MATTPFKLATFVVPNTNNIPEWTDPTNILLSDDQYAVSAGTSQVLLCGGFNLNLPQDASITNITLQVKGYRGSFNTTLQIYAVDDSTGVELSYPYTPPFQGFSGTNTLYTLLPSLFATTWTPNKVNNLKIKLIADGELHMDMVTVSVQYVLPPTVYPSLFYSGLVGGPFVLGETITGGTSGSTAVIVTDNGSDELTISGATGDFIIGETITGSISFATATVASPNGLIVVDEFVQAQPFQLAQSMTSTDLFCFVSSFNYPDTTTPIQFIDFHGEALIVVDQGKPGLEENIRLTNVEQNYNGTGLCRLSFGNLSNRGLNFQYPYTSVVNYIKSHSGTAEVVISNSAPFYSRFLRINQIDALVSAPIEVLDEGVQLTPHAHSFDFQGAGVVATNVGDAVTVTIAGSGTTPPTVASTSSTTGGNIQVPSLTWSHTSSGVNRLLSVQVSCEELATISGITYDGNGLTQQVALADIPSNLRSEIWTLVAPPVGTYNIVVTFSAPSYCCAGAESYVGVDQASPVGANNSSNAIDNNPTLILVTTFDNSLIVDSLSTALTPIVYTVGPGQTLNWYHSANTDIIQGASSIELAGTAPDNVTIDYTMTQSTDWVLTALEIKGITGTLTTDEFVKVDALDSTTGFLDDKIEIINGINTTVVKTILNIGGNEKISYQINAAGGGGGGSGYFIDESPLGTASTYGAITGAINGINTTFVNSQGAYLTGSLMVFVNGQEQQQGSTEDFVETNPATGTFDFVVAPILGDVITIIYSTTASVNQPGIQWEDEGVNLGTPGTVDEVDFTGAGVTATRIGNKVTVDVPGGSFSSVDVTDFDDFTSSFHVNPGGTSSGGWEISGNFIMNDGANLYALNELDHPGIIEIDEAGRIVGFGTDMSTNSAAQINSDQAGGLSYLNDFDITMLVKPNMGASFSMTFGTYDADAGTNIDVIQFNSSTSATNVIYRINGGAAVISGVALPTNNTWIKIRFQLVGTNLTMSVDGTPIFNGAITSVGLFSETILCSSASGVSEILVDYVSTNYTVTR